VIVRVCDQPGAGRNEIAGLEARARGEVSLKVRVRAQAEKGRANAAVIETLAEALGMARSRIALKTGASARTKTLVVSGEPSEVIAALERLVARRTATQHLK
jgi:hypothetical protein